MMPPAVMANTCLKLCDTPSASHTQRGQQAGQMAEEQAQTPMWNRMLPRRRLPRCSSWLDSLPGVLLAVEADQAAQQKMASAM
jgi:hypothetical protein